jgi:hypothetical protein
VFGFLSVAHGHFPFQLIHTKRFRQRSETA